MKRDLFLKFMKALIPFWNIIIFCYVWVLYYNEQTFSAFWLRGMLISIVLYALIYYAFGRLYNAFKIHSSSISELMLSQLLTIGMSDFILYMMCYLIHMRRASLLPGLLAAAVQLAGTLALLAANKSYFARYIPARKTIVIYGAKKQRKKADNIETSIEEFVRKLEKKHAGLFEIREVYPDTCSAGELLEKLACCDTVILCHVSQALRREILAAGAAAGKNVYITPKLEDILLTNYEYRYMIDTPLLESGSMRREYRGKRALDIGISLFMLVIFSPFMLLTAICIRLEDGGPVFYRQKRVTLDGREFDILKFRSMIVDAEKQGYKPAATKDSRITKTGSVIRATRIDELPQLLNILKGDMSIVGPRPERIEHVKKYTESLPEFAYRLRVRGGLTGYAQIYGKYNTSAEDKLKMDLMYIEKQSLLLDLQLILLTVKVMFLPESTEGF
ncbi:MAG: exopolysaccharide biosynthesis polyprenyl glycosylphosphotransferase [Lachnospiraceae bacterium]|nr:exopolysaccharide biosynthesis polyprenyl glycosylphosphotransferase [Lachnospiraceae bacterium]